MDDKGNLSLEEAQFLFGLLWANGCTSQDLVQIQDVDEEPFELTCPSWDHEAKDPQNNIGSCTKLHRHKICVALQLAARGEYAINISPATEVSEDPTEKRKELQELLEKKREIDASIRQQMQAQKELAKSIEKYNR